jgi:hypothetical protein
MLGVVVRVHCPPAPLREVLQSNWGYMAVAAQPYELTYNVQQVDSDAAISVTRPDNTQWSSQDVGQFLFELEGDLQIDLQQNRRDLYFLHAAAGEVDGGARLLVAESGGGKSTTLWGLLQHGWAYMSDELAPVDLDSMQVHAYPRALCLKRRPPHYPLPPDSLQTSRTIHVPVDELPAVGSGPSRPLTAVYFVNYRPAATQPLLRPIGRAEAAARLYANALNQLAHDNAGLDAAVQIVRDIPAFVLESADLADTCRLVTSRPL